MIATIIIFVVVSSFIAYKFLRKCDTLLMLIIISSLIVFVVVAAITISETVGKYAVELGYYEYRCNQTELVVIKDRFGVEGSFFLGMGSIDSEPYYVFYRKENGGGFKLDKIHAGIPTIYEEEREDGLMEVCHKKLKGLMKYFGYLSGGKEYEISVPKGTIKNICGLGLE